MKKQLLILATIAAVLTGVSAKAEDLFAENELSIMGFGTYVDKQSDHWGGGIGLTYFMNRHLGLGASTHWENFDGTFFDNIFGEVYLRLPLKQLPIAPYALGTAGYSWEFERWIFGVGGGAELRFNPKAGIFSDIQWMFNEGGDNDGIKVRFGFRLNM